jgi:membrane protein DedA with SNARE-associated domain
VACIFNAVERRQNSAPEGGRIFLEQLTFWISQYGYIAIFILLMLGIIGLPVPDETLLTLVGYLVLKGDLLFAPAFLTCFAGTLCGITVSFILGRTGGIFVLKKYGYLFHLTGDRLILVGQWFNRIGKWSLMIGYFLPGFRHVIAIVAGASGLRLPAFMIFAYSGALIWSAVFIMAGYIIGRQWQQGSKAMHDLLLIVTVTIVVIFAGQILYRRWLSRKQH